MPVADGGATESIATVPAAPPNTAVLLSHATSAEPLYQFVTVPVAVQVPVPPNAAPDVMFGSHWSWATAEAGTARLARTTTSRADMHRIGAHEPADCGRG